MKRKNIEVKLIVTVTDRSGYGQEHLANAERVLCGDMDFMDVVAALNKFKNDAVSDAIEHLDNTRRQWFDGEDEA